MTVTNTSQLAKHANGSQLVNFLLAFTVFTFLTTGLVAVGLRITVTNTWLAGVGFFTTLVGCVLCILSLCEE
jgi:uncharacterized Tic20 family protein